MITDTDFDMIVNHDAPHIYKGLVTRIVDGDTIQVRLELPFRIHFDVHIRVKDVDTGELRRSKCPQEKKIAYEAKDLLMKHFLGQPCMVRTFKQSFTRWVGDVIVLLEQPIDLRTFVIDHKLQKSDLVCEGCPSSYECTSPLKGTLGV